MSAAAVEAEEAESEAADPAPEGGAPAEAPKPEEKPETIRIWDLDVPTAEVATHFEAACPRRCEFGSRKVGRPFRGRVIYVRELCDCAVLGWMATHPRPEPIAAGVLAQAAADGRPAIPAPPRANPRGDQVRRLRTRRDQLVAEREAADASLEEDVAPMLRDMACEEAVAAAAESVVASSAGTLAALDAQLAELQRQRWEASQEEERARAAAEAATVSAAALGVSIEKLRTDRGGLGRALGYDIARVERRIARIIAYHPEADVG